MVAHFEWAIFRAVDQLLDSWERGVVLLSDTGFGQVNSSGSAFLFDTSDVFSWWTRPLQHQDSVAAADCSFLIALLKFARPSLKKTPSDGAYIALKTILN